MISYISGQKISQNVLIFIDKIRSTTSITRSRSIDVCIQCLTKPWNKKTNHQRGPRKRDCINLIEDDDSDNDQPLKRQKIGIQNKDEQTERKRKHIPEDDEY